MNQLPPEVLEHILLKIHSLDRLKLSAVCRHWSDLLCTPALLGDVRFVARQSITNETASLILMNTRREYKHLELYSLSLLDFDAMFWGKVGAHLRSLHITVCKWSSHSFYSILEHCPRLESLEFVGPYENNVFGLPEALEPPGGANLDKIRRCLAGVRHLYLKEVRLNGNTLDPLLDCMPNLTSFFLDSSGIDPLGFPEILRSMMKCERKFTSLALGHVCTDSRVSKLIDKNAGSLEYLFLANCRRLGREVFEAISACSALRHLGLCEANHIRNSDLRRIFRRIPDLETLTLDVPRPSDGIFNYINQLRKLKKLRISSRPNLLAVALEIVGRMTTVQDFDIRPHAADLETLRKLENLKDLRCLRLTGQGYTPESFAWIVENFQNLMVLDVGFSPMVDSDGVKLRQLRNLRKFEILDAGDLTDLTFENGVGSSAMWSLCIDDANITDVGLRNIVTHHSHLKYLSINGCEELTDDGLLYFIRRAPLLQELYMCATLLTDVSLRALETWCPRLHTIRTSPHMSKEARISLRNRRPQVAIKS
ncbi:dynein regulatory complex subunit 6 [Galendromus occidentalis]|uniref:Dynein regulatory complex subunit 6 n=1 Tax=Galendromus occidentalis TaxID=34638 RepID=A0AAJ7WI74_9ACAR|nr:dynein regulatory complex subunit 6 [Galendromus occidentalis]